MKFRSEASFLFKNLKVGKKITVSFAIVMVFYCIAVIASIIGLSSVSSGLKNFYNTPYPMVKTAEAIQQRSTEVNRNLLQALVEKDPVKVQEISNQSNQLAAELTALFGELRAAYVGDPTLLSNAETAMNNLAGPRSRAMELLAASKDDEAYALILGEYSTARVTLSEAMDKVIAASQSQADEYYRQGEQMKFICMGVQIALAVVSLILTVLLVGVISRGISRPVAEIEAAAKEMTRGNMKAVVTYRSQDELGQLAESMRFVLTTLSSYIDDIANILKTIASGNLTVRADMEYLGDFASIRSSLNQILDALNETMGNINHSAEQVAAGSDQVSSGAQALSQGATEQASSVEELAATSNDISRQVNENAKNATQVNQLIAQTANTISVCNGQMEDLVHAMTRIDKSSSEISKIIKTIEDIAFQTNILALNAAVEAARAGAAGKGFAVVADEVRNLASKSAEAAKNTTTLIEGSLKAVEEGNKLVGDTQHSLAEVVEGAENISTTMEQITKATNDQAEAIQQVTQGIDQISAVVQTNSATAEQSAAASEELSSQANILKSQVERFQLRGSGSVGALSYSFAPDDSSSYDSADLFDDNSKY